MFRWLKKLLSRRQIAAMPPRFMPPVQEPAALRRALILVRRVVPGSGLRVVGPCRAEAGKSSPVPYDCIPTAGFPDMPRAFSARDDWPTFVSPSAEPVSGGGGDFAGAGATSGWSESSDSCSSSSDTSSSDSGSSCSSSD